ncbi:MAG: glycosyltransferase family 9 protein [Acidobacteriota bacterium]
MSKLLFHALPKNSRIVFIRLRNLGEAVLDTANLSALKRFRPDLELTTVVEGVFSELYLSDPEINLLSLERGPGERRSSLRARLDAVRRIRNGGFDAIINLHGGPASAQLVATSGIRERAGVEHFRFGYVYNWRIPAAERILGRQSLHTVESQFAGFRWLGLPDDEPSTTRLFVDDARRATAESKLGEAGLVKNTPYAVLAPTNEFYTKRWMPERYAAIAEKLVERGYQVVMTGAPTDEQRAQLESVRTVSRVPLIAVSNLGVGELVAVIAGSGLFVGNDSGPAHIAAALKVPLVVLFGPASSVRWRPWAARAEVVQNYFPCNPCSMYTCDAFPEPECIRSITVEQVMSAVERVLRVQQ